MDTNETFEHPAAEPGLALTFEAQTYLREAGKWAYFLGIVGFIFTGLIFLCAFFVGAIFSFFSRFQQSPNPISAAAGAGVGFLSFIYILIAVFYFFFSFYLFQFGDKIKKGIMFHDEGHVTNAVGKLKSFFKLWGITTIVILSIYVLFFIIAIIAAIGAASMNR